MVSEECHGSCNAPCLRGCGCMQQEPLFPYIHATITYLPDQPHSLHLINHPKICLSPSAFSSATNSTHSDTHSTAPTNNVYTRIRNLCLKPPPLFPSPSSPWPQLYTKTEKPEPGSGGQAGNKTTRGRGVSRMFGIPAGGYVGGGERERDTHREREGKRGVKLHREVKKHAASNTNVRTRIDLIW